MTLWDIWDLVNYIGNKDFNGEIITPDRFAQLIKIANIDLFRHKYGLPEEYQPGRPIPREYADITLKNTDDMKVFKVRLPNRTVSNGVMLFPENYAHRDTIVYNFTKTINSVPTVFPRLVEVLRESEFASRDGNYTKKPTTYNPVAVMRNDGIHIRPLTVLACDFNYYRWPVDPVFNYVMGDGYITYNSTTSVECEWPKDEFYTLVKMILSMVGINLREADLLNYSESKLKTG